MLDDKNKYKKFIERHRDQNFISMNYERKSIAESEKQHTSFENVDCNYIFKFYKIINVSKSTEMKKHVSKKFQTE